MYCKKCGYQISNDDLFCSNCGAATNYGQQAGSSPAGNSAANYRICPSCGRKNGAGRFCTFCGASLLAAAAAPTRAAAQQAVQRQATQQTVRRQAAQQPNAQPQPKPAKSNKPAAQAKANKQAERPRQPKTPKVKKHKLVPLKVMLIIICVILIALGIFLIPSNIRAARKGSKPVLPFISSETSGTDLTTGKNSGNNTYSETDRIVIKEVTEGAPIPEIPDVGEPDKDEVFDTSEDLDFSTVVGKEDK